MRPLSLSSSLKAVVWDLDGTLYYQRRLRLIMLRELTAFCLRHPLRIREVLAVREFRRIRESWDEGEARALFASDPSEQSAFDAADLSDRQYKYTARRMKLSEAEVRASVETWIYKKPLEFLRSCRDETAAQLFRQLKAEAIGCYIFSDYPVAEKLKALDMEADGYYSATEERLGVLKPDPKGLILIMEDHKLEPGQLLMIGDRDSRDGEAARRAGCEYLILSSSKRKRRRQYEALRDSLGIR
ncbi:MAG TPA: hypothetical protein DCL38_02015 [Lachnospiraceae bacterium]|nr:hypothetical protein [Lachnospiraceae bacterium]